MKERLLLVILDGWGIAKNKKGNAIANAPTPNYDFLLNNFPNTTLLASGLAVGLPNKQMGNSEVGHMNIGLGRVVYQDIVRISKAVEDGSFFANPVMISAITKAKNENKSVHLIGLASDGGVHSLLTHLYATLELASRIGMNDVWVHAITDGRDTPPKSAKKYITEIENELKQLKTGRIATVSGRYYAMDRDKRWERIKKFYDCIVNGIGQKEKTAIVAIDKSYKREETDEFIKPTIIGNFPGIKNGDTIICYNFRSDRMREIMWSFVQEDFSYFERKEISVNYACMCEYDNNVKLPVAFLPVRQINTLGEIISKNNLSQFRIAETEKYAHVTFFFNGGIEKPNIGEERKLIPSPKISTYDLKPEMSAYEVRDAVINVIDSRKYDLIVLNFANPDMVGHTGVYKAALRAIAAVDMCLGKVIDAAQKQSYKIIVTADHGNAEKMIDYKTGKSYTAHTTNPVPFILIGKKCILCKGVLGDIAPTILELMKIKKPKEMTGKSLIMN